MSIAYPINSYEIKNNYKLFNVSSGITIKQSVSIKIKMIRINKYRLSGSAGASVPLNILVTRNRVSSYMLYHNLYSEL